MIVDLLADSGACRAASSATEQRAHQGSGQTADERAYGAGNDTKGRAGFCTA
ncbi:hypothetical protein [Paraburkholderia sediminicola]|uniref:hypothetical protein n=1 Tax=Paraburkholderia sediminicola TaxID=458836 RepID=UPI0038B94441